MRPIAVASAILASLVISGCAAPNYGPNQGHQTSTYNIQAIVDPSPWLHKGTGILQGTGFAEQYNGTVSDCTGLKVQLIPNSAAGEEFVAAIWSGNRPAGDSLPFLNKAIRETSCSNNGEFKFTDLPTARWIVLITPADHMRKNDTLFFGDAIIYRIESKDTQTVNIVTFRSGTFGGIPKPINTNSFRSY